MPFDATPIENETVRILRAAKARIENPENWCQMALALTRECKRVRADDKNAVQWCAVGTLVAMPNALQREFTLLSKAAKECGFPTIATLNNETDHPTVMRMFDRAIELAQQEVLEKV